MVSTLLIPCISIFFPTPQKNLSKISPLKSKKINYCLKQQEKKKSSHVGSNEKLIENLLCGRNGNGVEQVGKGEMVSLCGVGYFVNGLRGLPWLSLNFHMAKYMSMDPCTLQLVTSLANLPMVGKPLYGILSDSFYISSAHRIPYISIGVILQILSWGSLALIPIAGEARFALIACVLLSNTGTAIAEVAKDALVAEYGHKNKITSLQSYAVMATAFGGVLGNLLGGVLLLRTQRTKSMFLAFAAILAFQLTVSLKTREDSLALAEPPNYAHKSLCQSIIEQYSCLMIEIKDESIYRPLIWVVLSILVTPVLSGSLFCYQTQCLNLDATVIGMAKVTGQLLLLSLTLLYDRFGKPVSMRKLVTVVQLLYASSLLLDLILIKQINLQFGIPNELFALCFSGLAETIAQFKLLPFYVLFARLAPPGCEGSLLSILASALCLGSIASGFLGVGLASVLGITSGNYSSLPLGILVQFFAALVPICWINFVPNSQILSEKSGKRGRSKRSRRNRRVGRVVFNFDYSYRRERGTDLQ